jgi:hypothetical protein
MVTQKRPYCGLRRMLTQKRPYCGLRRMLTILWAFWSFVLQRGPAAFRAGRTHPSLDHAAAVLACIKAAHDDDAVAGRDGETALNQTEKHRHDGRDGSRGLYF